MSRTILSTSTGSETTDSAVRGLVGIFEFAFAGRIRSYYLEGSYADRTHVSTSDLDLTIVFKNTFHDQAERERASLVADECVALSGVELDITLDDDAGLEKGVYPSLKSGSLCLYGEDRREQMRLLPLDEWTRARMHAAYWLLVSVFERPRFVHLPIDYPDPAGAFYGYDRRKVRSATGDSVNSTRDLIRVSGWIATALLAHRAGVYVARKRDCHQAYRQHIDDAWAPLLENIYRLCRTQWGYVIPDAVTEQQRLRELCEQMLQFENHFLAIYKDYLLSELTAGGDDARQRGRWILEQIPFDDPAIERAVQSVEE